MKAEALLVGSVLRAPDLREKDVQEKGEGRDEERGRKRRRTERDRDIEEVFLFHKLLSSLVGANWKETLSFRI